MSTSDLTLKEIQDMVVQTTKDLGWRDKPRDMGDEFALLHSEISEAYEEHRDGHAPDKLYYRHDKKCIGFPATSVSSQCSITSPYEGTPCVMKPEGIPTEMADEVIRVMDFCEKFGIDLAKEIVRKNAYNKTRGYRHGGKVV